MILLKNLWSFVIIFYPLVMMALRTLFKLVTTIIIISFFNNVWIYTIISIGGLCWMLEEPLNYFVMLRRWKNGNKGG